MITPHNLCRSRRRGSHFDNGWPQSQGGWNYACQAIFMLIDRV
jgi:hypothetical protein